MPGNAVEASNFGSDPTTVRDPRHFMGRAVLVPVLSCGEECLGLDFPACGLARRSWRLVAGATVVVAAAVVLLLPERVRRRCSGRLHSAALRALGVRLVVNGGRAWGDGSGCGVLVVANHLSWIDALALSTVAPLRIVAKREIRGWPVIGVLTERMGAVFVDRARLRALQSSVVEITRALRAGDAVGVFPEGTTYCGAAEIRFRRAPFQAAIDAGAHVRPVAIALRLPDGRRAPAAYVADGTWWDDVCRIVRFTGLRCEVTVLPLIPHDATGNRREVALRAQQAITDVASAPGGGTAARREHGDATP